MCMSTCKEKRNSNNNNIFNFLYFIKLSALHKQPLQWHSSSPRHILKTTTAMNQTDTPTYSFSFHLTLFFFFFIYLILYIECMPAKICHHSYLLICVCSCRSISPANRVLFQRVRERKKVVNTSWENSRSPFPKRKQTSFLELYVTLRIAVITAIYIGICRILQKDHIYIRFSYKI
jgi:hypothetical protein